MEKINSSKASSVSPKEQSAQFRGIAAFLLLAGATAASAMQLVSEDRTTVNPNSTPETYPAPTNRAVVPTNYFKTPNELTDTPSSSYNNPPGHNIGKNEGRLRQDLRNAAAAAKPMESLQAAAIEFALGNPRMGNAYADLSVSGRRSFEQFRRSPPDLAGLVAHVNGAHDAGLAGKSPALIHDACNKALDRAYAVANAIRQRSDSPERQALGWIAVSGEDDMPYRPVNVPSSKYPQYDLVVHVPGPTVAPGGRDVNTRYVIAQTHGNGTIPQASGHNLAAEAVPVLANDAEIFLYVHGMDSRAEEAEQMVDALHAIAARDGKNYTIISVDLPSSGYADKLDHLTISPLEAIGHPKDSLGIPDFDANGKHEAPVLDFIENFIVSFVETLDKKVPIKGKLEAICGGSLGGNMALRLGRRTDLPWLPRVIAWSPGSIWESLADGPNIALHLAPRNGWFDAGGDPNKRPEKPETRAEFLKKTFDDPVLPFDVLHVVTPPQPEMWYRADWPCIQSEIVADRLDRQEIYNRDFRLWHWRLGTEQLIYSHQSKDPKTGRPLYLENRKLMILAAGKNDNFPGAHICDNTENVAQHMVNTPGKALFLEDTGHSIHNERPNYWAEQWVEFIKPHEDLNLLVASGNPLVRFTGGVHDWSGSVSVPTSYNNSSVSELKLTVTTGGDDLRAGSVCDAILNLRSGKATFRNISHKEHWDNGQTHSLTLSLPAGTKVGDILSLTLHTSFGGGIGGDNWNVNQVVLTAGVTPPDATTGPPKDTPVIPRATHTWLQASGNPLVRFTGRVHDWEQPVSSPRPDAGKPISELNLTIGTGSDDLRGGTGAHDNCDVIIGLASGASLTSANINKGQHWNNNATHSVSIPLPAGTKVGDIVSLTLHTSFRGELGGDNWNVNSVALEASY
jgi:pimeloyl-ACP methyl ester carboxylesterase